jgi:hypothetical protein
MLKLRVALALAVIWVLVLGTAAGVPWSAPLLPGSKIAFNGEDFRPVIGAGIEDGDALGIGATASDGNALQTTPVEHLIAQDLPILHYHLDEFPRTMELSLVFRRADAPNDVQVVLLPWPGDRNPTVDLSAWPAWHGEIIELGFAEYATAQLVPPSVAFRPFRLAGAQLASPSWSAAPQLLRTAWLGYQPWSLLSVSALGPNINALKTPSMLPPIALGAVLSLIVLAWLKRWSRETLVNGAMLIAGLAWVTLDLRWLNDLSAKHKLTSAIYAGKSWQERARLQPDEDIAGYAQLVRQQLGEASGPRVLIGSDSVYTMLRLLYFLLPLNVAPLDAALAALPVSAWPAGSVIVICASKSWHYDDAGSVLQNGARSVPVTPLYTGGELAIYRLRGAAP